MKSFKLYLVICFSLVGALVISGISCSDSDSAPSLWKEQPNERIVFMSKADSPEGELYLLDKNGQINRLTYNDRHENNPALSFDGKQVAFNAGDEGDQLTWEIYTLDIDTKKET